jgi:hypothetical protein
VAKVRPGTFVKVGVEIDEGASGGERFWMIVTHAGEHEGAGCSPASSRCGRKISDRALIVGLGFFPIFC